MNSYEAKLEARRERLLTRAQEANKNADSLHKKARSMAGAIPFGQPILVGHHSESRDRNYRERIHKTFGKAFAEMDNAQHYASKAAAVGTGGVSSDDPDAVAKLRKELQAMEASQERMKAA
ncbi:conjugal transfer protein TraC, partial [Xanthomonas euvesicatoria]